MIQLGIVVTTCIISSTPALAMAASGDEELLSAPECVERLKGFLESEPMVFHDAMVALICHMKENGGLRCVHNPELGGCRGFHEICLCLVLSKACTEHCACSHDGCVNPS